MKDETYWIPKTHLGTNVVIVPQPWERGDSEHQVHTFVYYQKDIYFASTLECAQTVIVFLSRLSMTSLRSKLGDRAFLVAGPRLCLTLPFNSSAGR